MINKKHKIINNPRNWLIYDLDLKSIVILIILSILFILIPPFDQTFLRILLTLPFLLFLPGYLLIVVMFPGRGELGAIERFTLSIGLSIATVVFDGFCLNYTPWGFRPNSIVISLTIYMIILLIAAYYNRKKLKDAAFSLSFEDIASFYNLLRNKEPEKGPDYDPALEKTLIRTMIFLIILVSAVVIYANIIRVPEKFTSLYILGSNGKAEDYPTEVSIQEPSSVLVGIENHEYEPVNYTLAITFGGATLNKQEITLENNGKWLYNVTFIPELSASTAFMGTNRSKLEFQLFRNNTLYRTVHLMVNTSLDRVKFAELPNITNGDMESDDGWVFSSNGPNITGGYNSSSKFSSRFYEINFTSDSAGSYGRIFQNITTQGDARAILSFDIRDPELDKSYYTFKQVLLDDKAIWESPIGSNNSWEHVEVPMLLSGNNTLAFQVLNKYPINLNVTVWLDNIEFRQYAASIFNETGRKPVSKPSDFKFDVRGEPFKLEKSIKINGFNFPGFKYDLNKNKSYEELSFEISNLEQISNDSSSAFIDAGNATYVTKINGSELNVMGSNYNIINIGNNSINISRLDIPSDKILTLGGDPWPFGDYSLSIKLISSKNDAAMLELKKTGKTIDSKLLNLGGIYEYKARIENKSVTIIKAKIEYINGDDVYLTRIEQNYDLLELKPGALIGDFEVTNISSEEIIFKNIYPIDMKDKSVIGNIGFRLSGDWFYPYASGVQLRGTPQYINSSNWMNITGFNYPGFYMENDMSYEELRMYLVGYGFVEPGYAVYKTKVHNSSLSFLGNTYELIDPNRPGYLSNESAKTILRFNQSETQLFEGYTFSFKNITNESVRLGIRKTITKGQQNLLEQALEFNESIYPDVNYYILRGKSNTFIKSEIFTTGDKFEYWEEFKEDKMYKKIAGEIRTIENNSIEMEVNFYDIPFEIFPSKTYGDFDVYDISSNSITLMNTKPLNFKLGNDTSILNGFLKIRTSSNEFLAYPIK